MNPNPAMKAAAPTFFLLAAPVGRVEPVGWLAAAPVGLEAVVAGLMPEEPDGRAVPVAVDVPVEVGIVVSTVTPAILHNSAKELKASLVASPQN